MTGQFTITDIIVYFIKVFSINSYMYYSFHKITNITPKKYSAFLLFNVVLSIIHTYIGIKIDSSSSLLLIYLVFAVFMSIITKCKIGHALVVSIISYALCYVAFMVSVLITFIPHSLLDIDNYYLDVTSIIIIQFAIIYVFFKIKRFKKGFDFINKKLNNDITDVVVSFIGVSVILVVAFLSTLYAGIDNVVYDISFLLLLLGITLYIMIQRTLTMHYKQTQLLKTMEEYKAEIQEKDKEIEKLSKEKYNTSKIRHEFYHRQKALELLVKSGGYNKDGLTTENTNQNVLDIINSLTNEYSEECERIKKLDALDKTDIPEIDSMFKYMQNECSKNNINFKLKIIGNIYPLVNNIISKSRLETLIGDHIKDAINAVNDDNIIRKEIFVILGVKDDCYELAIYDTGKEFEIDTLLKLGVERVTTCETKGGTGIGFMTTFETLAETKASLIITENSPLKDSYYTKSVTIRFDGTQQYIVRSYRAEKIAAKSKDKRVTIESLKEED